MKQTFFFLSSILAALLTTPAWSQIQRIELVASHLPPKAINISAHIMIECPNGTHQLSYLESSKELKLQMNSDIVQEINLAETEFGRLFFDPQLFGRFSYYCSNDSNSKNYFVIKFVGTKIERDNIIPTWYTVRINKDGNMEIYHSKEYTLNNLQNSINLMRN